MVTWDDAANDGMRELKAATNASDADMEALMAAIRNWAANNPDGSTTFPFAPLRFRSASVRATTSNGHIVRITFGDAA